MAFINIYSNKPTPEDFPERTLERMAEIEIFLMYLKLKNHAPISSRDTEFALDTLIPMLNPDKLYPPAELDLLRHFLSRKDDVIPTMDEYIIYLRYQGFGVNKITAITKKQHYYLNTLLGNLDTSIINPCLAYDWHLRNFPMIMNTSHYLAKDLFQIHQKGFHDNLGYNFPKKRKPRRDPITNRMMHSF